jgi:hypothetical protein
MGNSEEHCWAVSHCVATQFSYLGLQIAFHKLRPPTPHPGPWAGIIIFSSNHGIGITCPADKWDKAKDLLAQLWQEFDSQATLARKPLEKFRGFFIHLARTYPVITPYLKGTHLTLDGWRDNRDQDLWKLLVDCWEIRESDSLLPARPFVQPAPRLVDELACLEILFSGRTAPVVAARCNEQATVVYGFVDASSVGFGSTLQLPDRTLL